MQKKLHLTQGALLVSMVTATARLASPPCCDGVLFGALEQADYTDFDTQIMSEAVERTLVAVTSVLMTLSLVFSSAGRGGQGLPKAFSCQPNATAEF